MTPNKPCCGTYVKLEGSFFLPQSAVFQALSCEGYSTLAPGQCKEKPEWSICLYAWSHPFGIPTPPFSWSLPLAPPVARPFLDFWEKADVMSAHPCFPISSAIAEGWSRSSRALPTTLIHLPMMLRAAKAKLGPLETRKLEEGSAPCCGFMVDLSLGGLIGGGIICVEKMPKYTSVGCSTYWDHMSVFFFFLILPLFPRFVPFFVMDQQDCLVIGFWPAGTKEQHSLDLTFSSGEPVHCRHSTVLDYEKCFLWQGAPAPANQSSQGSLPCSSWGGIIKWLLFDCWVGKD